MLILWYYSHFTTLTAHFWALYRWRVAHYTIVRPIFDISQPYIKVKA